MGTSAERGDLGSAHTFSTNALLLFLTISPPTTAHAVSGLVCAGRTSHCALGSRTLDGSSLCQAGLESS